MKRKKNYKREINGHAVTQRLPSDKVCSFFSVNPFDGLTALPLLLLSNVTGAQSIKVIVHEVCRTGASL